MVVERTTVVQPQRAVRASRGVPTERSSGNRAHAAFVPSGTITGDPVYSIPKNDAERIEFTNLCDLNSCADYCSASFALFGRIFQSPLPKVDYPRSAWFATASSMTKSCTERRSTS